MRIGVFSDIHANYQALDAALDDASRRGVEGWWFLGDAVGYGGDPNAVVERLRSLPVLAAVRGNHDKVIAGIEEPDGFSRIARESAFRTRELISDATRAFLRSLPAGPRNVSPDIALCHGSWHDEDLYLVRKAEIQRDLVAMDASMLLFGHTHRLGLFVQWECTVGEIPVAEGVEVELPRVGRYLVNPGSVGQPRDRDPRAAYATLDTEGWRLEFVRVPYDIEKAQIRIVEAALPEINATRLAEGR